MRGITIITAIALAFTACSQQTQVGQQTVPYVKAILADRNSYEHGLIFSYDDTQCHALVTVIGSPDRASALADSFLSCDAHDNVDGRMAADGLPDFSGERIAVVLDQANAPYQGYLDAGNEQYLRELTVRQVVSAIDTLCYISPFDRNGMGRKSTSKLIVLASPYMSAYGRFDADTLFASAGVKSPVVCPIDEAFAKVFSHAHSKEGLNVGVISSPGGMASGAYGIVFNKYARKYGLMGSECVVFETGDAEDPLVEFTDKYLSAGYTDPLDAIIVDDFTLDVDEIRASQMRVTSVMSEESLTYSKLFTKDFMIYDTMSAATEACYRLMRERNIFTHNVAYPQGEAYLTVLDPEFGAEDIYTRASGSDIRTYMLVPYSTRYLSDDSAYNYVQDQR